MSNLSQADVYVDILKHNGTSDSKLDMDYVEERNQPLLDNPRDWKMSIVRLDFPSYNLPKRNYAKPPVIATPPTFDFVANPGWLSLTEPDIYDPDNSRWSITLAYQNPAGANPIISRVFVEPFDNDPDPPLVWTQNEQPAVFSFQEIMGAINIAFSSAYDNIVAAYNAEDPLGFGAGAWSGDADAGSRAQNPPFISYNNNTQLFSIYNPVENRDSLPITDIPNNGIGTGGINTFRTEIWMSFSLKRLFASFDTYQNPQLSNITGRVERFISFQLPLYTAATSNNYPTAIVLNPAKTAVAYDLIRQEFQTTNLWYDIYKILVLSKTMINRKEYVASQVVRDTGVSGIGDTRQLNILTDFDYEFDTANATRIRYVPSAEFRWIDLNSNVPLRKIDVQIAIINKEDPAKIIPLQLEPGDNFNCKILFRKKGCGIQEKHDDNNQNSAVAGSSNGNNMRYY